MSFYKESESSERLYGILFRCGGLVMAVSALLIVIGAATEQSSTGWWHTGRFCLTLVGGWGLCAYSSVKGKF